MRNKPGYTYHIRSTWKERTDTPAAVGSKFIATLDALTGIDPIFANWEVFDHRNRSSLPLTAARPRIAEIFEKNVALSDFKNPMPNYGYSASAMAGEFKDPRCVIFNVNAGGRFDNRMELQFGDYDALPDLAVVTYPLFRQALLAINAIWHTPWICAQAFQSGTVAVLTDFGGFQGSRIERVASVPSDPAFPYSVFHIPWIAYLERSPLTDAVSLPDIKTEHTPDGGLLMTVTEDRLDPTNPEHARRARILAETLIARTGGSE